MVESDFGTELPKVTEQKSAEAAAVPPLSAQSKPPTRKEPPVVVAADFGNGAAPQRTDTPQPAYLRYTPPEQKLYTPVSVAYYDPGNVAASNRKAEQTPPKALPNRIRNAGTAAAPRDLYYVQPEEYKGGITYREYGSVPEDYVNLIAQYEVAKQECESIERQMEEYARKHQYRNFADDSWYQALSAAHERAWRRYDELEEARNADWWSRAGNVIVGTAKETAGQLTSAAGTALEFIAQYGYHPAQIEAMNFNPSMPVPERDITLIKEYVTDPTRDFGDKLSQSGRTQVEEQKEGLGSFGRFAVDLGSAATQLVLDLGLGVITGGGMAVPAAIRAFGGAATEARTDGASLEEQVLYAATSAALSYGIESACNLAFKGLKAVNPGISDKFLARGIEKMATKLASTPEGAQLLLKLGTVAVSSVSESGEEFVEAALEPFLKKLTYDPNAETILDDPSLFADYLYEAAIGGILGAVSGSVNADTDTDASVQTDTQYGTLDKSKTTQAEIGEIMLNIGMIPDQAQLDAMGIDEATARGIRSIIWMGLDGDPQAQQAFEMMIDLTDGDGLLPERIENSDQIPLAVDMQYEHEFDSVYTGKIKWGIHDINVRQDGRGFWGQRIQQSDPRVDRYELQINPRNESYYLPHPEGGYVQFENMVNMTVQDGKLILNKKSFYHVDDLPSFAKSKVLAEARRQLAAAQVANYKVEWLISDKNAAKQLRRFFDQQNVEIKITYYPEDGGL